MEINYWAVLVCGVLSMIIGSIWFGPLFGKKWMQIIGATEMDMEKRKEMQKRAMPLYIISFVLSLFQAYVLSYAIQLTAMDTSGAIKIAFWLWAAFVIPTVAAGSMWNNDSSKISWSRFWIQAGHYLVLFVIFGLVLGLWR